MLATTQGFLIRTYPHCVCHPHHKFFSSAPVRAVAQVEKHCSKHFQAKRKPRVTGF